MIREIAGEIGKKLLRFSQPTQQSSAVLNSFLYPMEKSRQTQMSRDGFSGFSGFSGFRGIEPPPDYQSDWLTLDIDELTVNDISTDRLLVLLNAISPEISKACWDFQQFGNSSWTWTCETADGEISEEGTAATEAYMERIAETQISFNTIMDKLLQSAFVRGAYFYEMTMDKRTPVGFSVIDPITARARPASKADQRRGKDWDWGQMQDGQFKMFRGETAVYAPVNSIVTSPYGIPLINSSIFAAIFMIGLLYDIRRVISQQGYYRLDFSFDKTAMDDMLARNQVKQEEVDTFIADKLDELRRLYDQLSPSDSIVHTSDILVDSISGAMNAQGLGALNSVIDLLRNQLTLSCKSVPILMGINNSTSETHANRQWENYMGTIRSCQRTLADKLDRTFTLALRYQGIQAKVKFHFRELSVTTAQILAQAEGLVLDNVDKALNMNVRTVNAEGKEVPGEVIELMTPDQAKARWREMEELR